MVSVEVNNFNQIRSLLHFDDEGDLFYFLQIIRRKKDHQNEPNPQHKDSILIKSYFVDSLEFFDSKKESIIDLCKRYGARAYINLSPCSYEKCNLMLLKEHTDNLVLKNYKAMKHLVETVAGKYPAGGKLKTWVVDCDDESESYLTNLKTVITNVQPIGEDKIIAVIPTLHGYHIITKPFDLATFMKVVPNIDVHKNNPTLLYYGTDN